MATHELKAPKLRIPGGMDSPDTDAAQAKAPTCSTEYKRYRELAYGDVFAVDGFDYGRIVDHVETGQGPVYEFAHVHFTDGTVCRYVANLHMRVAKAVESA